MRSMKFFAAGLIALSAPAMAQTADEGARIVSDPLYLPLEGEVYGDTGYTYGWTTKDTFDDLGALSSRTGTNFNAVSQSVLYGATDDLALQFGWGYDTLAAGRHVVGDGVVQHSSSSWTNPQFGLVYRLMDQRESPLTLDLRADYAPDIFSAKTPALPPDVLGAPGGQTLDLGATLGHEGDVMTLAAVFDAYWRGPRSIDNPNSGGATRTDSLWNYRIGLVSQARLTDAISINAGAGHTFATDANVFNDSTGLGHITTGGDMTDVNAALNYQVLPNRVVASLEYQHNFYQNSRNLFPLLSVNDTSTRNKDEDLFGVRLRYVLP
ncbi:MAG TPA: hypothetical protein VHC42_04965 [Rhizomicrobium sp.]|nr:hypothetical protein [Rhizomicrobium sp.]